jgi:hypothetical protein
MTEVALSEAFSQGEVPAELEFPQSGKAAFARVGAEFSAAEKEKFLKVLSSSPAEMAPAEAERLVRGSYNTGGLVDGRSLPRIIEDPWKAKDTGVTCGPLSSKAFPKPLDPVDDLPPATVITAVEIGKNGRITVRGTTCDNGLVKGVRVNGREAKSIAGNYAQWEVVLDQALPDELRLTAVAEDAGGNLEKTPHQLAVILPK